MDMSVTLSADGVAEVAVHSSGRGGGCLRTASEL